MLYDAHGLPMAPLAPKAERVPSVLDGIVGTEQHDPAVTAVAENLPNAVADVSRVFPWEADLRAFSPKSEVVSWTLAYWYRARERWVLYDGLPAALIDPKAQYGMMSGEELVALMDGPPPRAVPYPMPISDVQHEMWRQHRVFALPFWVLQGSYGGHPVRFTPQQQNVLIARGLSANPPRIGSLPPCPFDERVKTQLRSINRLYRLMGSLDALRKSGSRAAADAEMAAMQKDIRLAEAAMIEQQMAEVTDMSLSLVKGSKTRSEHRDQIVEMAPGSAAAAVDSYQKYMETGEW